MAFDAKKIEEKYNIGSGEWLSLKEGDNKVRIVSDFADYGNHFLDNKFSVCVGKENNCQYCKEGNKPSVQFVGYAIDRKDGKVKALRIGYTIYKQLDDFSKNDEYSFEGDIPPYDITIVRKGKGKETEYTVIPARKNIELTGEEAEALMGIKTTPLQIVEKMKAKVGVNFEIQQETEVEFPAQDNPEALAEKQQRKDAGLDEEEVI